jgi:nitrogen regulatory protein PII
MKKVVSIICPNRLRHLKQALRMTGTGDVSVHRRKPHPDAKANSMPKVRVEIRTEDNDVEEVVDTIREATFPSGTESISDGRIFVIPLDDDNETDKEEHAVFRLLA